MITLFLITFMSPVSMHLAGLGIHDYRNEGVFRVEYKHLTNYIKELWGKILEDIYTDLASLNHSMRQAFRDMWSPKTASVFGLRPILLITITNWSN